MCMNFSSKKKKKNSTLKTDFLFATTTPAHPTHFSTGLAWAEKDITQSAHCFFRVAEHYTEYLLVTARSILLLIFCEDFYGFCFSPTDSLVLPVGSPPSN